MKKLYSLLMLLMIGAVGFSASAQQLRFGFELGGTISHSTWKFNNENYKTSSVGGFTAGISLDYEFLDNTFIQSGLFFLTKGAKAEAKGEDIEGQQYVKSDTEITFRPMYLQIPVTLAYKVNITPGIRVFALAGVFAAQGLTGEYTKEVDYSLDSWDDKKDSSSPFGKDKLKRLDAGVRFGGGLEFGKLVLKFAYDFSLTNAVKNAQAVGVDNFKNRSMLISAGLRF